MTNYGIKRVYEAPSASDGYRVLVDRLWPRGVSKEKAKLDQWCKEIAPSTELRTWFNHTPERFDEFSKRYIEELTVNSAVYELKERTKTEKVVTLLYGAHDPLYNQAVVLRDFLAK